MKKVIQIMAAITQRLDAITCVTSFLIYLCIDFVFSIKQIVQLSSSLWCLI